MDNNTEILTLLEQTLLTDNIKRKAAEFRLLTLEKNAGFALKLLYMVNANEVSPQYRFMSALYLKNMLNRRWNLEGGILPEEKHQIRIQALNQLAALQDETVAIQLANAISIVARYDFPLQWPNILPNLIDILSQAQTSFDRLKALIALYHCVKVFKSQKRPDQRNALIGIGRSLLTGTGSLFITAIPNVLKGAADQDTTKVCQYAQKILLRFYAHNLVSLTEEYAANMFVSMIGMVGQMLKSRETLTEEDDLFDTVDKYISNIAKMIVRTQESQPTTFIPYLNFTFSGLFSLLQGYVTSAFAAQSLVFYHNVLTCTEYRSRDNTGAQAIQNFFTQATISQFTKLLITKYMPVTNDELQTWEEAPEEYVAEEIRGDYIYQNSAEVLFSTLVRKYDSIIIPGLLEMFSFFLKEPSHILAFLTGKEAFYWALSLSYYELREKLTFDYLFDNLLVKDLQSTDPRYKILQKRIVQLIDGWIGGIQKEKRSAIYQLLIQLMNGEDYVIKLWSAITLRNMVQDVDFEQDSFEPVLDFCIKAIIRLVQDSSENFASSEVLNIVGVISKQAGQKIEPYAGSILQHLSELWSAKSDEGADGSLVKVGILRAMRKIVAALGGFSINFFKIFLPVIEYTTDISHSDEAEYLLKDGVGLWKELFLQCQQLSQPLVTLFATRLLPLLNNADESNAFDSLNQLAELLYLYISKGGAELVNTYTYLSQIAGAISKLILQEDKLKVADVVVIVMVMETLILLVPDKVQPLAEPLEKLLSVVLANKKEREAVCVYYLNLYATLIMVTPQLFFHIFNDVTQKTQKSDLHLILIDVWIKMMRDPKLQKRSVLALCSFLPSLPAPLWQQLLMECWKNATILRQSNRQIDSDLVEPGFLGTNDPLLKIDVEVFMHQKLTAKFPNISNQRLDDTLIQQLISG